MGHPIQPSNLPFKRSGFETTRRPRDPARKPPPLPLANIRRAFPRLDPTHPFRGSRSATGAVQEGGRSWFGPSPSTWWRFDDTAP
eukprot:scaffold690_cov327-Pavlova_lutheri.AAC.12